MKTQKHVFLKYDLNISVHYGQFTCEVFGQVWVVHETMTCKLYTLQSDRHMDVIKPNGQNEHVFLINI